MLLTFDFFAVMILFSFNSLTTALCEKREIPEDKQSKVFRTINVLVTILLVSSYIQILYQV